jgi:hypothetical protein
MERRAIAAWQPRRSIVHQDLQRVETQPMRSAGKGMSAHPRGDINLGVVGLNFSLKPPGWSFYSLWAKLLRLRAENVLD